MKRFILNPKVLWYSLIVGFSIFLFSLWEINNVIKRLKDEEYVETKSTANIRNTLLRMIRQGDRDYKSNGRLYKATAQLKNVKQDELYELAQKIEKDDISNIIDLILYVFITKEHHEIKEINSSVYIDRITKFPTAIDRAIPGKPVIAPFTKKYKCQEEYTRAYICLLATFILIRINRVKD